jgi:uncharacterized protein involved in exopolysaccharide biosynthesis
MAKYGRNNFQPVSSASSPRMGDLTVGDYANGMPNIRLGEMFKSLMRQMPWIIILLILGSLAAWYATKDLKRVYSGEGRILVQLGEEYVYNPVGQAANGNGLMTTIDTITLTEAALMKNSRVLADVIAQMAPPLDSSGRNRTNSPEQNLFDRDAFTKINKAKTERERQDAIMELRKTVESNYAVMPRAKSSIIDVAYKHENPDIAVATTNAFIENYMTFRRQVFVEGSSELIADRREATEQQLNSNERAIARFLQKNNISDFESEQTGLRERTEDLKAGLNGTRAAIAESEAALAEVEDQLRNTPVTIDLYRDDRAAQRISQAELELGQLMAKYLPTSDPVKQKQTELNELRALQSSYGGKASGGRRVGPNPTHQALTTRRNELAATSDSLREREFTQQRQLNSADAKIRKLTSLSPEFQNLLRERETLEARLTSYNAKEQEALVDAQQAEAKAENVKVISRAEFPRKGRNMQKLAWFGATAAWGLLLLFVALIRVFLDPRLYAVPGAVQNWPEQSTDFDDMQPSQSPIPEPIPAFDPGQPAAPNPYEAQPAAHAGAAASAYPQSGTYDPNNYVHYSSAGEVYGSQQPQATTMSSAGQYGTMAEAQNPYQMGYADPAGMPDTFAGNAALDLSHNPYATGEVQAGSFEIEPDAGYPGFAPDPNAPPQS